MQNRGVEKNSSRRGASCASSSGLGDEVERAEREIIGNGVKDIDIVAGVKKRAGKGERVEVDTGNRERKKVMHTT